MSPSIIPTLAPAWLNAIARFTDTVVLPTPPLPAPTAITFFTPGTACLVKSDPITGRTLNDIFTSTDVTPASLATAAPAWLASRSLPAERPGVAVSIVNETRPPSMVTSLTNFNETRSRPSEGSCTPSRASTTAASEITQVLSAAIWPTSGSLNSSPWYALYIRSSQSRADAGMTTKMT